MNNDTKEEINIILELLKGCLIKNQVSMALPRNDDGKIYFFDTETYLNSEKMDGFSVRIDDLVR